MFACRLLVYDDDELDCAFVAMHVDCRTLCALHVEMRSYGELKEEAMGVCIGVMFHELSVEKCMIEVLANS